MRIAVIADTHDRFPHILLERISGADEIWHLGDVCAPELLGKFTSIGPPVQVVLGNNDDVPHWPKILRLQRESIRFHLEHIPPARPPRDCDVVLHGHTHVPRDEQVHGIRWLNPGCITRPSRSYPPSFAWLTVGPGKPLGWSLVTI